MSRPDRVPRHPRWLALAGVLLSASLALSAIQADLRLLSRWVGTHQGRPLHLDFYGDTMLVVNDQHTAAFTATRDSLYVVPDYFRPSQDTTFTVAYWFARDRMLLQTVDNEVITMAPQSLEARPLHGLWRGSASRRPGRTIDLYMQRGGLAQWQERPGGEWIQGEWTRRSRTLEFLWLPDSVRWDGRHDPGGDAIQFLEIDPESGTVILRRALRW